MKTNTYWKTINQSHVILPLLLSGCLLALPGAGRADTPVSGVIVGATWTQASSPYIVVGDILVATLTIQPGVTVRFAGNYVFEVGGVLTAVGTQAQPIVFTAANLSVGWQGIYFNESSPSELAFCVVSNSVNSGIRIRNTSPIINNCEIRFNTAPAGGGINIDNAAANLTFTDCRIANNQSYMPAMNSGGLGGGIYAIMHGNRLEMTGCTVANNYANVNSEYGWSYGGGIYVSGHSAFKSCTISGNTCKGREKFNVVGGMARGGGVYSESGNIVMNNCIVRGNTAWNPTDPGPWQEAYGGGLCLTSGSLLMTNCIVQGNVASAGRASDGAGLCIGIGTSRGGSGTASIVNSTFAYNNTQAAAMGSGSSVTFLNSIVYFNASGGTQISGTATVTYSDVQNGFSGTGNISHDPTFWSSEKLMIMNGSECVDAGNPDPVFNDLCFYGDFSLGTVRNDMGAHGGPGACAWIECLAPTIANQPQDQSSCLGQTTAFCMTASGTPPFTYQWLLNGSPLSGQTSNCLVLGNLQSSNAGPYAVVVSNFCGSVTSAPAQLVVNDACVDICMYAGLTISGLPGRTYELRYTTDLSSTNFAAWTLLATNQMTTPWFYLDTNSCGSPRRFYGVKLLP